MVGDLLTWSGVELREGAPDTGTLFLVLNIDDTGSTRPEGRIVDMLEVRAISGSLIEDQIVSSTAARVTSRCVRVSRVK